MKKILVLFFFIQLLGCTHKESHSYRQFVQHPSAKSGIDFKNQLSYLQNFNIYTYRNFYNGGGVAVGDVNQDGWVDLYFTGNMVSNKLYLNRGDLTFEDVTETAGVGGTGGWSTGVSMADVNGDGLLDIYVCNSGKMGGDDKRNELFINLGNGKFEEMAATFGLDDPGYSTHAAFFDYDRDGDLDVYLLNNSFQAIGSFNLRKNERPKRDPEGGDKLFRNDGEVFTDVSEEAGIYGSVIGFGLGVTVGDINKDGWLDIYVSNDFFERDYIYMNQGDGTFEEVLEQQMKSISGASMGADMADLNNDALPDIFVTEMLPEPNDRLKTKTTFENWDRYQYNLENGYYHQFTRNMLQLNNGDGTFSEVGRLAGIEATDWSWGALIADFDNDGQKDLFVANGILRDLTDQDYINYVSTEEIAKSVIKNDGVDYQQLTDAIPSNKIPNYLYQNVGFLQFENVTEDWGLAEPSHSNGSAYGDLDNDGDLDLIINNLNEEAQIYLNQNERTHPDHHYLKIELVGSSKNYQAVGTKLTAYSSEGPLYLEQVPVKGFQSSVDPRPNFGLGGITTIDSLVVEWMTGFRQTIKGVLVDTTLKLTLPDESNYLSEVSKDTNPEEGQLFKAGNPPNFDHKENKFDQFDRDRLLYHMLTAEGPALCQGDFNQDGKSDVFVGGAAGQSSRLFLQTPNGWKAVSAEVMDENQSSEDVDCACFDADGDGDLDVYVASGSAEFSGNSSALIDRLYLNDGKGNLINSNQILPSFNFENSSCVRPSDVDGDGDLDLFVGVGTKNQLIGLPANSYLLINDGGGNFVDQTEALAPSMLNLGMVKDASWIDMDGDGDEDLIVVGTYMPLTLFINEDGAFVKGDVPGFLKSNGWWNTIAVGDFNEDGRPDLIVGNHGLNSRFKASEAQPVCMYINDFDNNGSIDPIICLYFGDESYPLVLRHDLITQLPGLKKKYNLYEDYKNASIKDMFDANQLNNTILLNAYTMESVIYLNKGNGDFERSPLPMEAQITPINDILVSDIDGDGHLDLLLGGNFYYAKPEVGRYDASYGTFLKGDGRGGFEYVPNRQIGLRIEDQVSNLVEMEVNGRRSILVAKNNQPLQLIHIQ
ncbi:MAG: hypothetical protein RLZZ248_2103 [Bacteroidota bacterium]